jgi:hypothetical protein
LTVSQQPLEPADVGVEVLHVVDICEDEGSVFVEPGGDDVLSVRVPQLRVLVDVFLLFRLLQEELLVVSELDDDRALEDIRWPRCMASLDGPLPV